VFLEFIAGLHSDIGKRAFSIAMPNLWNMPPLKAASADYDT